MQNSIDLNCDMGESTGDQIIGQDRDIMPLISSCNVACGMHGGDAKHMEITIRLAIKNRVRIGAHPSYPDKAGFGRRKMNIDYETLKPLLKDQILKVQKLAQSIDGKMTYVKPHGALYNSMAEDIDESKAMIDAILEVDDHLALMGKAGSNLEAYCKGKLLFIPEAFIDRTYTNEGKLTSRKEKGAVIMDPMKAVQQLLELYLNNQVITNAGKKLPITASSFCIHGDNPAALEILKLTHHILAHKEIAVRKYED